MRRALFVSVALAGLVAWAATSWAQTRPDFSGTWSFDTANSDPAPARRGGGGGRGGRGGGAAVATSMTVSQTQADLTIERVTGQGTQTLVYKLDGSESTNALGQGEAKSKASWEGATLVIATTQSFEGPNGTITIESREVYSVNGAVLTIQTTRTTPGGTQNRKLVYNKG